MKITIKILLLCVFLLYAGENPILSQAKYHSHGEMNTVLTNLSQEYPGLTRLEIIGETITGKKIYALVIGAGDVDSKPGIAVIGGIDGRYIASREIPLGFAQKLLEDSDNNDISTLLSKLSFYVIPDASPDASSAFFGTPLFEKQGNDNPTDNDRDFKTDEDPFEDLNGDGLITLMRVKDNMGIYLTDTDDERLMKRANVSDGERGSWSVYPEGLDNDNDGVFNEDGVGGVNFNNNFSFEYEEFGNMSGVHAVSEPEARAVADYLFDKFNIFAVFSFGPQDNLAEAFKPGRQNQQVQQSGRRRSRKVTNVFPEDSEYNEMLSEKYMEYTGFEGSPGFVREAGNFMEWAYYHYGRYSYSTPGWWFQTEKGKSAEASFLKYADEILQDEVFVEWQEVEHPDFEGKTVEIGGLKPFVMHTPPEDMLDDIIEKNYAFLVEAAKLHPEIKLIDLETEKLDKDLHRVTVKLHNQGYFATMSQMGELVKWVRKIRVELESESDFELSSGKKIIIDERIRGGESREYSWLIIGKGDFSISAGSVNCGLDKISFTLR